MRLTHTPTGITASVGESRSQSQNKTVALRRLRLRMAIELREPVVLGSPLPDWLRLDVSQKNELYPAVIGFVLDTLAATDWAMQPAREHLGVGSSQLVRFLRDERDLWAAVNAERTRRGLHPLT